MSKLKWRKLKPPDFSPACWRIAHALRSVGDRKLPKWPDENMEALKRAVWERGVIDAGVPLAALRKCVAFMWGSLYRRGEYRPTIFAESLVESAGVSHDAAKWAANELKLGRKVQFYVSHENELSRRYWRVRDRHLEKALCGVLPDRNCYFQHEMDKEETRVSHSKPIKAGKPHRWIFEIRVGFVGRVKRLCERFNLKMEGSGIIDCSPIDDVTDPDAEYDIRIMRVRRGRGYSVVSEWLTLKEIKREHTKRLKDSSSPF